MPELVVHHYLTDRGADPFQDWLDRLPDLAARIAIQRRIDRARGGNLGDHRACGASVWEFRIDVGPGYRVYFTSVGRNTLLILCAGSKRTQRKDIERAVRLQSDHARRAE